jgi:hypothetical protein
MAAPPLTGPPVRPGALQTGFTERYLALHQNGAARGFGARQGS